MICQFRFFSINLIFFLSSFFASPMSYHLSIIHILILNRSRLIYNVVELQFKKKWQLYIYFIALVRKVHCIAKSRTIGLKKQTPFISFGSPRQSCLEWVNGFQHERQYFLCCSACFLSPYIIPLFSLFPSHFASFPLALSEESASVMAGRSCDCSLRSHWFASFLIKG